MAADLTHPDALSQGRRGVAGQALRRWVLRQPRYLVVILVTSGCLVVAWTSVAATMFLGEDPLWARLAVATVVTLAVAVPVVGMLVTMLAELEWARQTIADLASLDELTGLYSRRHLLAAAEREVTLAQRYGRPLSVVMLDIDHFKRVNDTWGHPFGDAVLVQVATAFSETLRTTDLLGRHGGEEFVAVLPGSSATEAAATAERLRAAAESLAIVWEGRQVQVTISAGTATLGAEHGTLDALVGAADQALYAAKRSGRDRVCASA